MTTVAEFLGQIARFGPTLETDLKAGLGPAARFTRESILHSAQQAGWPLRTHGMGPLKIKSRVSSGGSAPQALVWAAGGAAYAFEGGARGHPIAPRGRGKQGPRVLASRSGSFGPVAYVAHHPGFRGRSFWDQGVRAAEPKVLTALAAAVDAAMRRSFR